MTALTCLETRWPKPRLQDSRLPDWMTEGITGSCAGFRSSTQPTALRNYTNAPNSSLRELIGLNKQMYPGAF